MQIGRFKIELYIGNEDNLPSVNYSAVFILFGVAFVLFSLWFTFAIYWLKN